MNIGTSGLRTSHTKIGTSGHGEVTPGYSGAASHFRGCSHFLDLSATETSIATAMGRPGSHRVVRAPAAPGRVARLRFQDGRPRVYSSQFHWAPRELPPIGPSHFVPIPLPTPHFALPLPASHFSPASPRTGVSGFRPLVCSSRFFPMSRTLQSTSHPHSPGYPAAHLHSVFPLLVLRMSLGPYSTALRPAAGDRARGYTSRFFAMSRTPRRFTLPRYSAPFGTRDRCARPGQATRSAELPSCTSPCPPAERTGPARLRAPRNSCIQPPRLHKRGLRAHFPFGPNFSEHFAHLQSLD